MKIETKIVPVSGVKVLDDEEGIVEAFVAATGNKDATGDIIEHGAFEDSLSKIMPKGVWGHDWNTPVARTLAIKEVPPGAPEIPTHMQAKGLGGLYVKMKFNLDTSRGRDAYSDVKFFGDEAQWSIGYSTRQKSYDQERKARILKKVDLYEYSPVLFGANSMTSTVSLKVLDADDFITRISNLVEKEEKAVPGSFESRRESLAAALTETMKDGHPYVVVTGEDYVVYSVDEYDDGGKYIGFIMYKVSYTIDDDDNVTIGSDPVKVELVEQIVEAEPGIEQPKPDADEETTKPDDKPVEPDEKTAETKATDDAPAVEKEEEDNSGVDNNDKTITEEDVALIMKAILLLKDENAAAMAVEDENFEKAVAVMKKLAGDEDDEEEAEDAPAEKPSEAPPGENMKSDQTLVELSPIEIMEFEMISAIHG